MIIVKSSGSCASTASPDGKFIADMQKFNNDLAAAGVLLALEGLHPGSNGVRVNSSAGKWKVSDGPFAETKEMIGGFWIWQVNSKQEAIEWVTRCPMSAHAETEIEVRQVLDTEEFAARLAPEFVGQSRRVAA
jgi:hypothetical protein